MKADFLVFVLGFLLVGFGLGGVENSVDNGALALSCIVSLVGLSVMAVGTQMIKQGEA